MRVWIHGNVSSLSSHSVTFTRLSSDDADCPAGGVETINFDYMIYALGATLPSPVNVWGTEASEMSLEGVPMGSKKRGVEYMQRRAETMKRARSILVVGGGALGIRQSGPTLAGSSRTADWYRAGNGLEGRSSREEYHSHPLATSIDAALSH